MAVVWKSITMGPDTNNADYIPQWSGANTNILKDGLQLVTSVGSTGADTAIPSEQAVREALANVSYRHSDDSTGTGADQEISHGFASKPDRLELIPLESGVTFSDLTVDTTHFHVTVTTGKTWAWVAEQW